MNKYISIAIVLVVIVLGAWLVMKGPKKDDTITNPEVQTNADTTTPPVAEGQNTAPATQPNTQPITNKNNQKTMATITTSMGDITVEFYAKDAPNTVANFIKLADSKFYDGIKFHRVIKNFMIQVGDPLTRDDSKVALWGTGGPGYKFADEINAGSDLYKTGYKKGILAMANSGPNTNGSQIFIMTADYPLPPLYTIFAHVTAGQDVVDKIANVKTGPNDRPVDPITIKSITLK